MEKIDEIEKLIREELIDRFENLCIHFPDEMREVENEQY